MASPAIISRASLTAHSRSHTHQSSLTPSRLQHIEAAPPIQTPQRQQKRPQQQQTPQQYASPLNATPTIAASTPIHRVLPLQASSPLTKSPIPTTLSPSKAQVALQTAAYHRNRDDYQVLHFPLYSNTIHSTTPPFTPRPPPALASESRLGLLDRLPYELQCILLRSMSVRSLYAFRSTSTTARQMVYHLHEYFTLISYTPGLLRAVLKTDITDSFTIPELYSALTNPNPECCTCSDYASFYSLVLHKRVCLNCIENAPEHAVITLDEATTRFALHPPSIGTFISVTKTLPVHGSVRAVSGLISKALKAFPHSDFTGKHGALTQYIDELLNYAKQDERHRLETAQKDLSRNVLPPRQIERTVLDRPETEKDAYLRHMVCVPIPFLNLAPAVKVFDSALNPYNTPAITPELETGVVCTACGNQDPMREVDVRARRRVYTNLGFKRHFEQCVEAKEWIRGILIERETEPSYRKLKKYLDECKMQEVGEVKIY